jgi:hypothetical protein
MKKRSQVYNTYWHVAAERQSIFFNRLNGEAGPLTLDPIFKEYKFCNSYRASDRVSQFLIKDVIYNAEFISPEDTAFRIFFFRLINKSESWNAIERSLGRVSLDDFNFERYDKVIQDIRNQGTFYGNAFILCANKVFKHDLKHQNHLSLLEYIFRSEKITQILNSKSLKELFKNLRTLPLIGDFMAYQMAIDLNYSELFDFSENDFTIAGPGAVRGIRKCFSDLDGKSQEYVIQYMVENQDREFERLGIKFQDLFGRKLHAIDCQGLFCETDKYCRVKFPELASNRVRMKSKYSASKGKIEYFYPPKWNIKLSSKYQAPISK